MTPPCMVCMKSPAGNIQSTDQSIVSLLAHHDISPQPELENALQLHREQYKTIRTGVLQARLKESVNFSETNGNF